MNDAPAGVISGPPGDDRPSISVVVVAYGPEDWLGRCVDALLTSEKVHVEVVVVDNGGTEGRVDALDGTEGVVVVRPGTNTGFAGGCNLGVTASSHKFVALINPDAIVEPDALAELHAVIVEHPHRPHVIATASVRLADRPELLNSGGNDVHFLGVSWAGCFEEPAADHDQRRTTTAASGAAMMCPRSSWDALGGFCDELFAYYEDAELSLRAWQRGGSVEFVPSAVVLHRYEFSRNPTKNRLLERNRLIVVLTCFSARHLLLAAPFLLAFELVVVAFAAKDGWLGQKLAGYRWLLGHRGWLRERRRSVRAAVTVPDRRVAQLFTDDLDPQNMPLPSWVAPFNRAMGAYWRVVRRFA
jgi:GT2 family glycosyltransferase